MIRAGRTVQSMTVEDDREFRKEMSKYVSNPGRKLMLKDRSKWGHQGYANKEPWVTEMWNKYRTAPGMPPTDGWKQDKKRNVQ